jgi:hypothetical protein
MQQIIEVERIAIRCRLFPSLVHGHSSFPFKRWLARDGH